MKASVEIISLGEHTEYAGLATTESIQPYYFQNKQIGKYGSENPPCFIVKDKALVSHYFIGVDWLNTASDKVIHVSPKLNKKGFETDYLRMLLVCLKDSEASKYVNTIYEIKKDCDPIEIDQTKDLISPILIFQFLNLVKQLVKKGLKKSYYRVERNLNSRVKGKLLVAQTLKHHTYKNNSLTTRCAFDVFGLDHPENQLLKATLQFIQKYLAQFPEYEKLASSTLSFCLPAFNEVTVPKNLSGFSHFKTSAFFSSYKEAIGLAQQILQRYGNNVRTVEAKKIKTQPFWINMALLFELYTFTLLREKYGNRVRYQYKSNYQELDFLLDNEELQLVIDTKYKLKYGSGGKNKEDIRQLSGYARMENIYTALGKNRNEIIDCLIIYPHRCVTDPEGIDLDQKVKINDYVGFYQIGVDIPHLK